MGEIDLELKRQRSRECMRRLRERIRAGYVPPEKELSKTQMAQYMRAYRRKQREANSLTGIKPGREIRFDNVEPSNYRNNAIYDPVRDGPVFWSSPAAELMGDPPLGRRAIDKGK